MPAILVRRHNLVHEGIAIYPFERFTERAKHVLTLAQEEAEGSGQSYIGTEHLLLGLLRENDGIGGQTLSNLGIDTGKVREVIESAVRRNQRLINSANVPLSTTPIRRIAYGKAGW